MAAVIVDATERALRAWHVLESVLDPEVPIVSVVDVGIVRMSATMPMPGAATMSGSSELKPTPAPGRYEVATDLSMAGAWYFQIDWNGPAGRGSARLESRVK